MQKVPIFPTLIYTFQNDNIDNIKIIELLSAETLKEHTALSSTENLHCKPEYNDLFTWFDKCLEELRQENKYDCDKIEITSSWANKYYAESGMYHSPHKHSMSMYSGVYYLTKGAATVFEDPVHHRVQAQIEVLRHNFEPFEYIEAVPGKLILFPSWMFHSTTYNTVPIDRWSIAFNTFPAGKINYNLAKDSIAILDVKSKVSKEVFDD